MAEPIISQQLVEQVFTLLARYVDSFERYVDAYERRLDFEERRDVRIAKTADIRDKIALKRLESDEPVG